MSTLGNQVINPEFEKLQLKQQRKCNELLDLDIKLKKIDVERAKVALQREKKCV